MSIEDVAHELYGLAPEEFTSARNARAKEAKADGDPELAALVQSLRKPTAGAWLLNQLVRRHEEQVAQVLDLGARLRAAQGTLGAEELRGLDRQRRQLTRAVAEQARTLGRQEGRQVSDQAVAAVEETLRSAMVDAAAGAALRTGLLTDTFSSTGLEPVDLSTAVALPRSATAPDVEPPPGPSPAGDEEPDPAAQRRLDEARDAVAAAEQTLRSAREVADRARDRADETRQQRELLESAREQARLRLDELDAQVEAARQVQEDADRARDRATGDEASAAEETERLRSRLEGLEPG